MHLSALKYIHTQEKEFIKKDKTRETHRDTIEKSIMETQ
jgi:hypothetical protein